MSPVQQVELDIAGSRSQPFRVMQGRVRRVVLVLSPGKVENRRTHRLVDTGLPVARQAAADREDAADGLRAGGGEAIVQGHRLREADEYPPCRRNRIFNA